MYTYMYVYYYSKFSYYVTLYSAEAPERGASRAGALRGHLNKEKLVK